MTYPSIAVFGYDGVTATPVTDGTNSADNGTSGTATTSLSPGGVTPAGNGRIIIAGLGFWGWAGPDRAGTVSIDASMTVVDQLEVVVNGGNLGIAAADYIQPAAGAITPTFSWPTHTMGAAAVIAAFKIAADGGAIPVFLTQYRRRRG